MHSHHSWSSWIRLVNDIPVTGNAEVLYSCIRQRPVECVYCSYWIFGTIITGCYYKEKSRRIFAGRCEEMRPFDRHAMILNKTWYVMPSQSKLKDMEVYIHAPYVWVHLTVYSSNWICRRAGTIIRLHRIYPHRVFMDWCEGIKPCDRQHDT